jgi:hypothetical protein
MGGPVFKSHCHQKKKNGGKSPLWENNSGFPFPPPKLYHCSSILGFRKLVPSNKAANSPALCLRAAEEPDPEVFSLNTEQKP